MVEELLAVVPTQEALVAAPRLGARAWRALVAMPELVALAGIELELAEGRQRLLMAD